VYIHYSCYALLDHAVDGFDTKKHCLNSIQRRAASRAIQTTHTHRTK